MSHCSHLFIVSACAKDSVSNSDAALKAELECCLDENLLLQEMLDRQKKELNETQSE